MRTCGLFVLGRKCPLILTSLLLTLLRLSEGYASQVAEVGSPEYETAVSLEALRRGDFHSFATNVDRESLIEFRELWLPVMQMMEASGRDSAAIRELSGGRPLATLHTISPESFLMTFLHAAGYGPISSIGPGSEVEIIGKVLEGDSLAHVVYSIELSPYERSGLRAQLMTLRKSNDKWRILLGQSISVPGSVRLPNSEFQVDH
jgi:hypothetical protein